MERKIALLPGEVSQAYPVNINKGTRSNNELREVPSLRWGRPSAEAIVPCKKWEGPNNRKAEEGQEGGQCDESRISWKQGLPAKG
jgi:hypothetical protein